MNIGIVVLAIGTFVFAVLAYARAKRIDDQLSLKALTICPLLAGLALLVTHTRVSVEGGVGAACLLVCAATDYATGYVYDVVTLPAMLALAVVAGSHGTLMQCAFAACLNLVLTGGIYFATRRRGMGLGDIKLFVVAGMSLFALPSLWVLCVSFIGGGIVALVGLLTGRLDRGDRIPFAPFIAAAAVGVIAAKGVH